MRPPVRQASLVSQVSDSFRELIASGEWAVGSKIPGELELAESLEVSRATVREALRGLTITGLLEPRVGDGTRVRATDEITGVLVRDDLSSALGHVLDARAALEASSARLAATNASAEDLAALERALIARSRAHETQDILTYVRADADFHRAVVASSGNPLLIRLHSAVGAVLDDSIRETSKIPEERAIRDAHHELFDAIAHHDADAASAIAYRLIDAVKTAAPVVE